MAEVEPDQPGLAASAAPQRLPRGRSRPVPDRERPAVTQAGPGTDASTGRCCSVRSWRLSPRARAIRPTAGWATSTSGPPVRRPDRRCSRSSATAPRCPPAPGARAPSGPWTSCRGWSGEADDPAGFVPRPEHAPLVLAHRRYGHYRVGRTEAVFEALAPACIEQVVTGKEAFRAWRLLVREFGEPAPGPATDPDSAAYGMCLPPTPEAWSRVPSWRFLAAGVEQRRSRTLVRTAVRAPRWSAPWPGRTRPRTGRCRASPASARGPRPRCGSGRTVTRTPGASATTTSPRTSRYALTGEALDDDACLEILEPYRGHRFRVQVAARPGRPAAPAPGAADDPADPHPVRDRRTLLRRTQRCQRLVSSAPVGADPGSGSSSGRARNAARSNTR